MIDVGDGETFEIVLEGNFTTGYRWELDRGDDALPLISEEIEAGGDASGSAGTQHFKMMARSKGSYSLRFLYRRPWEDSILTEREVIVRVA
jgi:predicted secreted protein